MNPRPIIVASTIAVLFVIVAYLGGKLIYQGHIKDTSPPTVSKRQVDNTPTNNTNNEQQTSDSQSTKSMPRSLGALTITQQPAPVVDTEKANTPTEAETPTTTPTEETSQAVTGISPFGLGPYPEVPPDFPEQNIWEEFEWYYREYGPEIITKEHEILDRVYIKLWTQGDRPTGVSMKNGLVYPDYSDVIYMTREILYAEDGSIEGYKANLSAPEGVTDEQIDALIDDNIVPEGYTVIPHSEATFDPYEFLNMKMN